MASLRVGGGGWRKHIIILGISQIITDGERIPSHLARLDARQRGNGAREVQGTTFPGRYLSLTARDRHGFGRGRSGGRIVDVLTAASELARRTGGQLGSGANGRASLGGGGGWVVGFTLRGNQEGIKGIMLRGAERKGVAFIGSLCLRGKVGRVGGRTLMELSVVSPISVPTHDGLGVAPDKGTGVRCLLPLPQSGREALTWALTCPCPASRSDGHVEASLGQVTE